MSETSAHFRRSAVALLALTVLVVLASGCSGTETEEHSLPKVGSNAPDFSLEALDGSGTVNLTDLRGRPVLINFWATWCPPCVKELPSLEALGKHYEARGLALYAISVDSDAPRTIRSFLADRDIELDVLLDSGGALARRYGTFRFPETYLIDATGRIAHKYVGEQDWTADTYTGAIEELLTTPPTVSAETPAAP